MERACQLEHLLLAGFTASLLRGEAYLHEDLSVKGEQGGIGGGVEDEREIDVHAEGGA